MKYAFITDSTVATLYNLTDFFIVPSGESSKSIQVVEKLASELVQKGYGRGSVIVGVGGGMICDLAGFLSSIFCRGVPLILIPTTLLAMVDASIGGKTAINLPYGKNLLGSTVFPKQVIFHLPFLKTLPDAEWENGIIEILKVGLLFDPDLFFHFSSFSLSHVLERAIEAKRRIIAQDPYDLGCRALLNFGHTMGHALESLSSYTLSHGKAVAAGIVIEARLSHATGLLPREDLQTIENRFPPLELNYNPDQIIAQLSSDKKAKEGIPHFVLLKKIGEAHISNGCFSHPVKSSVLTQVIHEACLCPR